MNNSLSDAPASWNDNEHRMCIKTFRFQCFKSKFMQLFSFVFIIVTYCEMLIQAEVFAFFSFTLNTVNSWHRLPVSTCIVCSTHKGGSFTPKILSQVFALIMFVCHLLSFGTCCVALFITHVCASRWKEGAKKMHKKIEFAETSRNYNNLSETYVTRFKNLKKNYFVFATFLLHVFSHTSGREAILMI